MRIAFVTTEFVTEKTFDGGLANYLFRTCSSLQKQGIHCTVFVDSEKNEILDHHGIRVVRVKPGFYLWFWLINALTLFRLNPALLLVRRSFALRKALLNAHQSEPFDLVQYSSTRAVAILQPKTIPTVVRISSYQRFIDEMSGTPNNFRTRQKQLLNDLMLKRSRHLFGPSRLIGQYISETFKKPVEIIESPFVLDPAPLDTGLLETLQKDCKGLPYLLYFGSLTRLKGLPDIAGMIGRLLENHPELCFVFIGKDIPIDNQSMVEMLKQSAGSHAGRVLWYPGHPHASLYPVIREARLVVLPSRIDNFPNTCIEAMAFGKTVIGTHKTSFEQLIDDGVSGWLCEPGDPDSLLKSVENALQMDELARTRMAEAAMQRIRSLDPEAVINQLLAYYKKVISLDKYSVS